MFQKLDKERAEENELMEKKEKEIRDQKENSLKTNPWYNFFTYLPLLSALLFGISIKFNEGMKIGWKLGMGILFFPIIFSWFTLQKGYDNTVRFTSFTHLIILYVSMNAVNYVRATLFY